ncbi:NB-ARC domains-containing protein [Tanacetum coccineum]
MAPSSSHIAPSWKYDVFVSFRGEDIRNTFVDHLFSDFERKGIYAFKDDKKLKRGEEISSGLYEAIEQSRFLIVIFSNDYASSTWCLRELVKILECKKKNDKYEVRALFYNVTPEVVKNQSGTYLEAFMKHEASSRIESPEWKKALTSGATLSGWNFQASNGQEPKFIERISNEVFYKLTSGGPLDAGENLVGLYTRANQMGLLQYVDSRKVNMIGICGIGGIGVSGKGDGVEAVCEVGGERGILTLGGWDRKGFFGGNGRCGYCKETGMWGVGGGLGVDGLRELRWGCRRMGRGGVFRCWMITGLGWRGCVWWGGKTIGGDERGWSKVVVRGYLSMFIYRVLSSSGKLIETKLEGEVGGCCLDYGVEGRGGGCGDEEVVFMREGVLIVVAESVGWVVSRGGGSGWGGGEGGVWVWWVWEGGESVEDYHCWVRDGVGRERDYLGLGGWVGDGDMAGGYGGRGGEWACAFLVGGVGGVGGGILPVGERWCVWGRCGGFVLGRVGYDGEGWGAGCGWICGAWGTLDWSGGCMGLGGVWDGWGMDEGLWWGVYGEKCGG